MKTYPRPTRRAEVADIRIDATPDGHRATLPTTPIPYEVTPLGKGEYETRHTFTLLECSLGGHVAMLNNLIHFGDAYADSEEEWEALVGSRLDTILRLRVQMGSKPIRC